MKCIKIQSMITPFINDKLSDKELEEFLEHVDSCSVCREELEVYYALLTAMKQLDEDKHLSSDFVQELDDKLEEAQEKLIHAKYTYYRKMAMLFFTMIFLVILISFSYANRGEVQHHTVTKSDFHIRMEYQYHKNPYLEVQLKTYLEEHRLEQAP